MQVERGLKGVLPFYFHTSPIFKPQLIEDLLIYGSLPGIIDEPRKMKAKTLEAYAELYLEEGIRRESLVKNIGSFANFLKFAAIDSRKQPEKIFFNSKIFPF